MSWIVQSLWNNRERIKGGTRIQALNSSFASLYGMSDLEEDDRGYEDPLIESDEFNDLLIIEKAVAELRELNLLSPQDLETLNYSGLDFRTKAQKETFVKQFDTICQRIAYYLGGYFTDEGYINYLTRKYRLNLEQQNVARLYMRSKFRNKILRKGYTIENKNEQNRIISTEV